MEKGTFFADGGVMMTAVCPGPRRQAGALEVDLGPGSSSTQPL